MASLARGGGRLLLCVGLLLTSGRCRSLAGQDGSAGGSVSGPDDRGSGRLIIGPRHPHGAKPRGSTTAEELMGVDADYQADMGWGQNTQPDGGLDDFSELKSDDPAVERILRMEPRVECSGDSMTLQVQDSASGAGALLVDRGALLPPLPLSSLPASCGYSVRSTQRNLVLVAPYDGCFVAHEADGYVLPLRWSGLPVRMSCPGTRQPPSNPPTVTCHTQGMVVKMECSMPVSKLRVKLNGTWEPLMKASSRCGFGLVEHPEGLVISVRYAPCLEIKDGMYILVLAGEGETKISCPSPSPAQPEPPKNPTQTEPPSTRDPPPTQSPRTSSAAIAPEPTPASPEPTPASPEPTPASPEPTPASPEPTPASPEPAAPEVPEKTNGGPKDIYDPQLPYFPFYPNFYYPYSYPANPHPTPALGPKPTPAAGPKPTPAAGPKPTPAAGPKPTPAAGPKPTPAAGPKPTPAAGPKPTPAAGPKPTPAAGPKPTPAAGPKPTPAAGPKPTPAASPKPHPVTLERHLPKPLDNHPRPPQEPVKQPEGLEYNPFYPQFYPWMPQLPPHPDAESHPWYPEKLPEQPLLPKPPVSEERWGQMQHPLYPYMWFQNPYQMPLPSTDQTPTTAPKGEVELSMNPLEPETSKPKPLENVEKVHQPFYDFYQWPEPEKLAPENPTAAPKPPKPENPTAAPKPENPTAAPKPPELENPTAAPKPENPTAAPKPPKPENPTAAPKPENPTAVPKPPEPEKPTAFPNLPEPEKRTAFPNPPEPEKPPAVPMLPKQSQPESPYGQMFYPFYLNPYFPNHLYPQPNQPEETNATPEAPQGNVHQPSHPSPREPQPQPEGPPAEKPTVFSKPAATEASKPQPSQMPDTEADGDKVPINMPVEREQPPKPHRFYPYYYPLSGILPPAAVTRQPQQVTTPANKPTSTESTMPQPSNIAEQPQGPHPGSSYGPPVRCPLFCPPGFSNCCPQIAFHQHLHHIVPPGRGGKEASQVYPGMPFLPPAAYSGFGNGFASTPPPQKSTEGPKTSTSAPVSPRSPPPRDEKLEYLRPPDGHAAALPGSKPSSPGQIYPYVVVNPLYPNWPYQPYHGQLQNLPQRQSAAYSKTHVPIFPLDQYVPYNMQQNGPNGELRNPTGLKLLSLNPDPLQPNAAEGKNQPAAREMLQSDPESSRSEESMLPEVQGEGDLFTVPKHVLQNQAPAPDVSTKRSVKDSGETGAHDQTPDTRPEPQRFVLLQQGPPGRESSGFQEPLMPFGHPVHNSVFLPQNLEKSEDGKRPPPKETLQHPNWLRKGMSHLFRGNGHDVLRPAAESEDLPSLSSAPDGLHFRPSPQDPSLGPPRLKPRFLTSSRRFWKPMTSPDSYQRVRGVPETPQRWEPPADGLNHRIRRSGRWKPT